MPVTQTLVGSTVGHTRGPQPHTGACQGTTAHGEGTLRGDGGRVEMRSPGCGLGPSAVTRSLWEGGRRARVRSRRCPGSRGQRQRDLRHRPLPPQPGEGQGRGTQNRQGHLSPQSLRRSQPSRHCGLSLVTPSSHFCPVNLSCFSHCYGDESQQEGKPAQPQSESPGQCLV